MASCVIMAKMAFLKRHRRDHDQIVCFPSVECERGHDSHEFIGLLKKKHACHLCMPKKHVNYVCKVAYELAWVKIEKMHTCVERVKFKSMT
jgi:hypothetical protein